jgi:hypothetical protein
MEIAAFWLALAAIVVAAIYFRHARTVSRHQVLQTMIEKGQPVSTEIFDERNHRSMGVPQSFLAGGILLIGLSCGLATFFSALQWTGEVDERFLPAIAAIPFCLGIACLIASRFLKPE